MISYMIQALAMHNQIAARHGFRIRTKTDAIFVHIVHSRVYNNSMMKPYAQLLSRM